MNRLLPALAAALVGLASPEAGRAERAPRDRGTATVVVEGTVERVDVTPDGEYDGYTVSIRVAKVEKGDGVKAGDLLKASCSRWARPTDRRFGEPGHDAVPAKGDRVKAFLTDHQKYGGREGVFPDWFDRLPAAPPAKK